MSATNPNAALGPGARRHRHRLIAAATAAALALIGMVVAVLVALGSPTPAHAGPSSRPHAVASTQPAAPSGHHPQRWTAPVTSTR